MNLKEFFRGKINPESFVITLFIIIVFMAFYLIATSQINNIHGMQAMVESHKLVIM